jgi:hypothetical protein
MSRQGIDPVQGLPAGTAAVYSLRRAACSGICHPTTPVWIANNSIAGGRPLARFPSRQWWRSWWCGEDLNWASWDPGERALCDLAISETTDHLA